MKHKLKKLFLLTSLCTAVSISPVITLPSMPVYANTKLSARSGTWKQTDVNGTQPQAGDTVLTPQNPDVFAPDVSPVNPKGPSGTESPGSGSGTLTPPDQTTGNNGQNPAVPIQLENPGETPLPGPANPEGQPPHSSDSSNPDGAPGEIRKPEGEDPANPDDPNQSGKPEDPEKPGGADQPEDPSHPDGEDQPNDSNNPGDSEKPDEDSKEEKLNEKPLDKQTALNEEKMTFSASIPSETLPEETELAAAPLSEAHRKNIPLLLEGKVFTGADLSFQHKQKAIQPKKPVEIVLELSDPEWASKLIPESIRAVHFKEEAEALQMEEPAAVQNENGVLKARLTITSMSPFVIYGELKDEFKDEEKDKDEKPLHFEQSIEHFSVTAETKAGSVEEGTTLKVVQFAQGSPEYEEVRAQVLPQQPTDQTNQNRISAPVESAQNFGVTEAGQNAGSDQTAENSALAETANHSASDKALAALDISFWHEGKEVEPKYPVDVRITIEADAFTEETKPGGAVEIQHLEEKPNGNVEAKQVAATSLSSVMQASFQVDSFSRFAVLADRTVVYAKKTKTLYITTPGPGQNTLPGIASTDWRLLGKGTIETSKELAFAGLIKPTIYPVPAQYQQSTSHFTYTSHGVEITVFPPTSKMGIVSYNNVDYPYVTNLDHAPGPTDTYYTVVWQRVKRVTDLPGNPAGAGDHIHLDGIIVLHNPSAATYNYWIASAPGEPFELVMSQQKNLNTTVEADQLPKPEDKGQTFKGWYIDEACTQLASGSWTVQESRNFYGYYSEEGITQLTIDIQNSDDDVTPVNVELKLTNQHGQLCPNNILVNGQTVQGTNGVYRFQVTPGTPTPISIPKDYKNFEVAETVPNKYEKSTNQIGTGDVKDGTSAKGDVSTNRIVYFRNYTAPPVPTGINSGRNNLLPTMFVLILCDLYAIGHLLKKRTESRIH